MPYFTLQVSANGLIVDAFIAVSGAKKTALLAANQQVPQHQVIRAMLDTGASSTCVDPLVLNALGLTATGSTLVNTPSTGSQPQITSTFDIGLTIPCASQAALTIDTLEVVESHLFAAQGFHALIGRDVLQNCLLTYDGKNRIFSLAY